MSFRPHAIVLAVLASLAPPGHAGEALTQTTITIYSGGKPAGGLIFPIGGKSTLSAIANSIEDKDKETRFKGNVEGRFSATADQSIIIFGEDVVKTTEAVSAERARAVRDLEAMAVPDQLYRGRSVTGDLSADEWKQQTAIDTANMKRLAEIIDTFGWPGLRFAGAASQTAFLVLQHADQASQHKYLPLLRNAVKRSDAMGSSLAMLEDRVRLADGKPQLYGTQLTPDKPLRFAPIEDEAHVDERRRSVGLPPMTEYARIFGLSYAPRQDAGPGDPG